MPPAPNVKKYHFFQLLTKNSQIENLEQSKLKVQYKHEFLSFFCCKDKEQSHTVFIHNTLLKLNLCLKSFLYVSTFPNIPSSHANFPNSEVPAPIPKILKMNTVCAAHILYLSKGIWQTEQNSDWLKMFMYEEKKGNYKIDGSANVGHNPCKNVSMQKISSENACFH